MATRHQARERVISLLYALDSGNDKISKFVDEILEDKKIRNQQKEFAIKLFNGVKENLEEIDKIINDNLIDRRVEELGAIERAIIRLGTYEFILKELHKAIIINEAIELSKELGSDNSPAFINGVLDSIQKSLEKK